MPAPATPLSSIRSAKLNAVAMSTPTPTMQRLFDAQPDEADHAGNHPAGMSPLHIPRSGSETDPLNHDQENVLSKARHSRILSGHALSPLKILASQEALAGDTRSPDRTPSVKSARKRFPVKVNNNTASPEPPSVKPSAQPTVQSPQPPAQVPAVQHREITLKDAVAENKELARAIDIFEDDETMMMENADDEGDDTFMSISQVHGEVAEDEHADLDDTMISTFSTFSAVPDLTMFARIGHTPSKYASLGASPSTHSHLDLSPERTPRPSRRESGNTTNLLDFTDQIQGFSSRYAEQMSNLRRGSPGKASASTVAATPNKRQANLLDFDIPPLPTPRSIPTITPRELESLKSGFLSEISSLKASLSGKEAEVLSLKTAVADAEKRVGECLEELREVRAVKEGLIEQQESWAQRGRDMESVLRKVKEEIVRGQRERDQVESKLEESEKRREAAEMMAQEAESKMAAMRAGKISVDSASDPGIKSPEKHRMSGSREVEIAVEKVSRELHALYKSKHESKITALKKSYENRWSKRVFELEAKIEELADDNEKLRIGRDATMTKVDPNQSIIDDERKAQAVKDSTHIRELNAEVQKLSAVVTSITTDNHELRLLLEKERVEKGELVQLAEEMMSMQSFVQTEAPPPPPPVVKPRPASQPPTTEPFRSSIRRRSGIQAPSSIKKPSESRIGGIGHERKIGGGLPRPGSGMSSRSGIMSSIEKMGNHRGRGD
ncbi:hypothetical protein F5Y14DRAFT_436993 [Nemania sp. NC0429]|nr:hypothetical protein F5Y14DRAFT_436993 [Nemania sp. NC0429]